MEPITLTAKEVEAALFTVATLWVALRLRDKEMLYDVTAHPKVMAFAAGPLGKLIIDEQTDTVLKEARAHAREMRVGYKVYDPKLRLEGVVTRVELHNPENPIEEHGSIEIKIIKPGNTQYQPGDIEHYVHHRWHEHLHLK